MLYFFFFIFTLSAALAQNQAELKIVYDCQNLHLIPHEDEKKMSIDFYDTHDFSLKKSGLTLRQRQGSKNDLTLKARWPRGQRPEFDQELMKNLSQNPSSKLKCEWDLNFEQSQIQAFESCSFEISDGQTFNDFTPFLKVIRSTIKKIPETIQLKASISSRKWKVSSKSLNKNTSLELWQIGPRCLLEASSGFKSQESNQDQFIALAGLELQKLRDSLAPMPLKDQVLKTDWALKGP